MNSNTPKSDRYSALEILNATAPSSSGTVVVYTAIFLLGAYTLLHRSDRYPTLSVQELLWNFLVHATPSSVVLALDRKGASTSGTQEMDMSMYAKSRTFAAKSEAMRRIVGIEGGSVLANLERSRSLSGLGSIFKIAPTKALPGLGNWDNSCYQNSILQGLASIPSLYTFLQQAHTTIDESEKWSANAALKGLIEDLNHGKNSGMKLWTPPALKNMSSWQQQDAQEYYSKVVDEMEKEIAKTLEKHPVKFVLGVRNVGLAALKGQSKPEQADEKIPEQEKEIPRGTPPFNQLPDELSAFFRNPLEGLLAQRVGCLQCGFVEGLSLIPFNCLTVPLGMNMVYDIRDCFDEYTTLEPISGVECANCTLLKTKEHLERLLAAKKPSQEDGGEEEQMLTGPVRESTATRLKAVVVALSSSDFSETTLVKKCMIPSKNRVTTTKSRQAVIARAPKALVVHVNRSMFDELTGMLSKNYADVRFSKWLNLSQWCLGSSTTDSPVEIWNTDPSQSMLAYSDIDIGDGKPDPSKSHYAYSLRAIVTHYGRHENGHYIAYRQTPTHTVADCESESSTQWWRLSDEDVSMVSEESVLGQGGVFMLFYERASQATKAPTDLVLPILRNPKVTVNSSLTTKCTEEHSIDPTLVVSQEMEVRDSEYFHVLRTNSSNAVAHFSNPLLPASGSLDTVNPPSDIIPESEQSIMTSSLDSGITRVDSESPAAIGLRNIAKVPAACVNTKSNVTINDDESARATHGKPSDADTETDLRAPMPRMRTSSAATDGQENLGQIGQSIGMVQAV